MQSVRNAAANGVDDAIDASGHHGCGTTRQLAARSSRMPLRCLFVFVCY
jgi:hypothetical protein